MGGTHRSIPNLERERIVSVLRLRAQQYYIIAGVYMWHFDLYHHSAFLQSGELDTYPLWDMGIYGEVTV